MLEKTKNSEYQSIRKFPFFISIILHFLFLLIFNYAAMYMFKTVEKKIIYLELATKSIQPAEPSGSENLPEQAEKTKPVPMVNLPEITRENENGVVTADSLNGKKPGSLTTGRKNVITIPDSIKTIAELKILIAEDIKKNYSESDQERIRKMWEKYKGQHPYGPTYDGYLGTPGISIPIDDIIDLFK
ncbi:MAG: hypothetical protein R6W90_09305 [Ignavibacteriaceae bacterium]